MGETGNGKAEDKQTRKRAAIGGTDTGVRTQTRGPKESRRRGCCSRPRRGGRTFGPGETQRGSITGPAQATVARGRKRDEARWQGRRPRRETERGLQDGRPERGRRDRYRQSNLGRRTLPSASDDTCMFLRVYIGIQ